LGEDKATHFQRKSYETYNKQEGTTALSPPANVAETTQQKIDQTGKHCCVRRGRQCTKGPLRSTRESCGGGKGLKSTRGEGKKKQILGLLIKREKNEGGKMWNKEGESGGCGGCSWASPEDGCRVCTQTCRVSGEKEAIGSSWGEEAEDICEKGLCLSYPGEREGHV